MRVLERILTWGAATVLLFVALLVTSSVSVRALFNKVVPDAFDLSTLTMAIVVFWGLSVAVHRDEHIRVQLFEKMLSARMRALLDLISQLVVISFFGLLAWLAFGKLVSVFRGGEVTTDLRLPIWIPYAAAWLGLALAVPLGLHRLINDAGRFWRQRDGG